MSKSDDNNRLNLSAGVLSVSVASLLVLGKLWALQATGALSIAATLADSALDLLMSLGGLIAIAYAAKPADKDHHFGHTAVEDLTALAQSLVITASAVLIALAAIRRMAAGDTDVIGAQGIGMVIMVLSIVLTLGLVAWQRHVARRTGSRVVAADSLHYIGDLIPNIGALIALAVSALWGIGAVDSVIALLAAGLMLRGAAKIGKQAWDALMDRSAPPDVIATIEGVARDFDGIIGYHDLKTRTSGSRIFVTLHIEMDGNQTLFAAHRTSAALRRAIVRALPNADVMIHKDPFGAPPHPDDERQQ
ncbi:cation diffusion facilitator family transporter [Ketogulonicigenium vulgare]|uniref:Putative transport system permease protein n=1 Tax=Ketogulonicigenium vulgare (strain WSH-001) TaxID=759362 RepID=F9Y8V2_KETVW|nr:cation diffusion facilitator family transporter [Ketogulonicigenium vulgare]ADO41435.1 cation efflux family protein [Ketogulonicigenium vulgare Y25]AEM42429.1 putative transport system permease protein [Ketogulonicigenium vulgare WSH-001]ALJ80047.1 ABC transporter permease [Ketogulonicigenium vulgare]ANW32929.1 ABC transporter permease [Ketogulonicigenium vulgare]AOZ53519.1 cation efflux family protein [Ketogulonicigenium vulgare]